MRWLLIKDLQILRRSPLLVALLVLYPVALSLLVGFGVSRGPDKPKVAFANLVDSDETAFELGGQRLDAATYAGRLFDRIDPIVVDTREEAIALVRSGKALGGLIIPEDATRRLRSALGMGGGDPPELEVIYNAEDPVKRRYVQTTIRATLAEANQRLSVALTEVAGRYLNIVVAGGSFKVFGRTVEVLGLRNSQAIIEAALATLPADSGARAPLERVAQFARLAGENLDISEPILSAIGEPIRVKQTVIASGSSSLDGYAIAVAVAAALLLITGLLAAGMLALEREDQTFARLVRGLVSRLGLLAEKVLLAALCGTVVGLLMLAVLALFADLPWSRAPLWLPVTALAAAAFAAFGVALGGLAREVRAASLLCVMLCLPVIVLGLIPSGAVGPGLYSAISAVNAVFPFKPALDAFDVAVNDSLGSLLRPLAHLALLVVAFLAIGRIALRRF